MTDHAEFEELCGLWATHTLTDEERSKLLDHLPSCRACQTLMERFEPAAAAAMAALASDRGPQIEGERLWNSQVVKQQLVGKFSSNSESTTHGREGVKDSRNALRSWPLSNAGPSNSKRLSGWVLSALRVAAGILLASCVSLAWYWTGPRRAITSYRLNAKRAESEAMTLQQEVGELRKERDLLDTRLKEDAKTIANLGGQIEGARRGAGQMQASLLEMEEEKRQLEIKKEQLTKSLQEAQASVVAMRGDLDSKDERNSATAQRLKALEADLAQQSALIRDKEKTIEEQRELLTSDRDIRDLMGARELLITDVYDVDENGKYKKPFARAFFTKDKSLIFYGFDLDKQAGVTNANSFQVWGDRGSFRNNAISFGILYQDAATNRRWILKIDNPETLQQVSSIFVTIEPKGGSQKPTGKALLFAYLRVQPNHP